MSDVVRAVRVERDRILNLIEARAARLHCELWPRVARTELLAMLRDALESIEKGQGERLVKLAQKWEADLESERERVRAWYRMLDDANKLTTSDLERHARVSESNEHKCVECFTCACVVALQDRRLRERKRD